MRSALVTGASTGIGKATALRLDGAGWRVFAGVRREEDAAALRSEGSERLTPVTLDVTDAAQIAAAAKLIAAESEGRLDGLVNNAGIGVSSPLETIPIEDFRRQIEVNLTGQVAVTQALLPLLRRAVPSGPHASERNRSSGGAAGRIVLVSSVGGRIALPFGGPYHAAKFGLEAVGDVLRQELRPWGIAVSIVEPGSVDTPIWERTERLVEKIGERSPQRDALYGPALAKFAEAVRRTAERGIPPQRVAAAIERALTARRPRTRYPIGLDAKVQARLRPLIPTPLFDRIVARTIGL